MSTDQASSSDAPARNRDLPSGDRSWFLVGLFGRLIPAVVVLLVPVVVVPLTSALVRVPAEDEGRFPVWAVEAFGAELLHASLAALALPLPILMLYGLAGLAVPLIGAMIGLGTVGRWASLGGFCLVGSALGGLLALGMLLELVAPQSGRAAFRLEILIALTWPLLALEGCGCLLAASAASSGSGGSGR